MPALAAVLAIELVLIGFNVAALEPTGERSMPRLLYVGGEWSLPEMVQYGTWTLLAVLLGAAFRAVGEPVYGVWALAFAFFAVDDAAMLHERIGRVLSRLVLPDVQHEFLELAPMVIVGLVVLCGLSLAHRAGPGETARRYSGHAFALVLVYGAFAIGVDIVHVAYAEFVPTDPVCDRLLLFFEDGGELISATLLFGYTARHVRHGLSAPGTSGGRAPQPGVTTIEEEPGG